MAKCPYVVIFADLELSRLPMTTCDDKLPRSSPTQAGSFRLLVGLCCAALVMPSAARAGDLLHAVPSNSLGFLYAPSLQQLENGLGRLRQQAFPAGRWRLDASALESVFGLAAGTIDADRPVLVVFDETADLRNLLRSDGVTTQSANWPVLGFFPKHTKNFTVSGGGTAKFGSYHGPYGRLGAMRWSDAAFVTAPVKHRTLRQLGRALDKANARMPLPDSVQNRIHSNHLSFHVSLVKVRNNYMQQVKAIAALAKLNAVRQVSDADRYAEAFALVNWMGDGTVNAIEQMEGLTLALTLDEGYVKLSHLHTFDANGWMSEYFGKVRRSSFERFETFADRPFMMAASVDWKVPAEQAFTTNLVNVALNASTKSANQLSAEQKQSLREVKIVCERTSGQEFCATVSTDGEASIQILGTSIVSDGKNFYEIHRRVQDFTNRLMATVIPGSNTFDKGEFRNQNGRRVYSVAFTGPDIPDDMRRNVEVVYGRDAVYQEFFLPPSHVVYSVAPEAVGFTGLAEDGKPLLKDNLVIRQAVAQLPEQANVMALVDLSRFADAIPRFVRASQTATLESSKLLELPPVGTAGKDQFGPLLCWSATAESQTLAGQLVISHEDLRESLQIAANIGVALSQFKSAASSRSQPEKKP